MEKVYDNFKSGLEIYPFIIIVGKYDQLLGPRELFSSFPIKDGDFFNNLLRDALHTTNEYVTLNFDNFYSQICKVKIKDSTARGGNQLFAIILLRQNQKPLLPKSYLERIKEIFQKIDKNSILLENKQSFYDFFGRVNEIYLKKEEILPIESLNLQIRNSLNTIQGFCELILEEKRQSGEISEQQVLNYLEMMLDSCKEIVQALESIFNKS